MKGSYPELGSSLLRKQSGMRRNGASRAALTFNPVDRVGLQGRVSQLKDLPQVRRYLAQLECRAVNEFVHVVK